MYDITVFIGRFQPFHKGHLHNIIKALSVSNKVIINVGSSFNAPNIKNPFTFEQRKSMIQSDLKALNIDLSKIKIEPLADYFYQEEKWEKALHNNVSKHSKASDKIALVGHQKDASSYYLKSFSQWEYVSVDNYKSYNATDFRKEYYNGNILNDYMCIDDANFGTNKFLHDFMKTKQYQILKEENQYITDYKKKWESAPYKPIFVTVDALVIVNNHILLIQRKQAPGKDLWALPGGFVDNGEVIAKAIIRELREETNIEISDKQLALAKVDNFVFDYPSRSIRGQTITHVGLFMCDTFINLPKIKANDDAKLAKWIDIESVIKNMHDKMFDDHYQIINILLEKFSSIKV